MPVERDAFKFSLRTKIPSSKVEAYNWVVSICLKYVSLPWHMVNSLRRGASEPWAWREFYKDWPWFLYRCMIHSSVLGCKPKIIKKTLLCEIYHFNHQSILANHIHSGMQKSEADFHFGFNWTDCHFVEF